MLQVRDEDDKDKAKQVFVFPQGNRVLVLSTLHIIIIMHYAYRQPSVALLFKTRVWKMCKLSVGSVGARLVIVTSHKDTPYTITCCTISLSLHETLNSISPGLLCKCK
jgi:hypothetical protein